MPAPGPKDGHASKASRDIGGRRGLPREIKNVAVKSNGFKGLASGGGDLASNRGASGVRLGEGGSSRSVEARRRLRERFERRRAMGGTAGGGTVGKKRARSAEPEPAAADAAAAEAVKTVEEEEVAAPSAVVREAVAIDYFCAACSKNCGSRSNWDAHVASKKHRAAAERERGREILAALKNAKRQKHEVESGE